MNKNILLPCLILLTPVGLGSVSDNHAKNMYDYKKAVCKNDYGWMYNNVDNLLDNWTAIYMMELAHHKYATNSEYIKSISPEPDASIEEVEEKLKFHIEKLYYHQLKNYDNNYGSLQDGIDKSLDKAQVFVGKLYNDVPPYSIEENVGVVPNFFFLEFTFDVYDDELPLEHKLKYLTHLNYYNSICKNKATQGERYVCFAKYYNPFDIRYFTFWNDKGTAYTTISAFIKNCKKNLKEENPDDMITEECLINMVDGSPNVIAQAYDDEAYSPMDYVHHPNSEFCPSEE